VMQTPSPVDSNVCLLFVQLHGTSCTTVRRKELTAFLPHINCNLCRKLTSLHLFAEFDVVVTVILGHLLSTGFVRTLKHRGQMEAIVEQQVVCHADSVGLHGMPLTIVCVRTQCQTDESRLRLKLARLANVPG
uniref:Uncharacterized protein n=1 Tax=Seriola dumerili TaxID=41447 RepID=A0A3B4UFX9_SERDU